MKDTWRSDLKQNSDGTWRVEVWKHSEDHMIIFNPEVTTHTDALPTYEDALRIETDILNQLNGVSPFHPL